MFVASGNPVGVGARGSGPQRRLVVAGLVVAIGGAVLVRSALRRRETSSPAGPQATVLSATVVDDTHPVPEFRLSGTQGDVTRQTLEGQWTFVFFGYTYCPDVCPTTLGVMKKVRSGLNRDEQPRVLFVSVDPARDSLDLLKGYVSAFDPTFIAATGSDEALAPLLKHFGAMFQRNNGSADQGHYTVDHTAAIFLVDPQARLKAVFSPPFMPQTMLADLRRLTRRDVSDRATGPGRVGN